VTHRTVLGRNLRSRALAGLGCALLLGAAVAPAQGPPESPRVLPVPRLQYGLDNYQAGQLAQIDQLIRLGYHSRANALLEELAAVSGLSDEILRRRIEIALIVGDHAGAATLCREALTTRPEDAGLWRELAAALIAQHDRAGAREALDRYLALVAEPAAGFATAVDLLRTAGDWSGTVALVDSARSVLADPGFLARPRALCLLRLERPEEAAREVGRDLAISPLTARLLRQALLAAEAPPLVPAFTDELARLAAAPAAPPELAVLAANLALAAGRVEAALALVRPGLDEPAALRAALDNAGTLARELPLLPPPPEQAAVGRYLLAILPALAERPELAGRLRQRALDNLAEACAFALANDLLGEDPAAAATRYGELLALVRAGHPESEHLYAAQIQLACFVRDRLRDPGAAAARLERRLLDLDLPLDGVALVRLALGETYLAGRDTLRARQVLTVLGRDAVFREPAGHAHFLLAKLDLAEGHFGTSRDRFAAVALDDPAAPYANDALELGLVVAEELQNATGGPDLLARYARAIWWELAAEPDSQRVALQRYIGRAAVQVDVAEPQPLLERARWELAVLERRAGRTDEALEQLERIVLDQPAGRLAAAALAFRGEILAADRHDATLARREYERLLLQYPDYLFATEIRQRLKDLP